MDRFSFVARKQRIFDGIHNRRKMDGGKKPQAKTGSKERNFWFSHFWFGRIFEKSVLTEKVEKISPTHPRRFALQSGPPSFGLGAGNRGAIRGFSSFFRASEKKLKSKFPGNSSGKVSSFGEFWVSHFVLGFLDPRSKKIPNRGPRRGSIRFGWEPEWRRTTTNVERAFLIHRMNRSSFVARKQRIFADPRLATNN